MRRALTWLAAVAAFAFSVQAFAAAAQFVLITHAPDADPFWNVVKNAIKDAGQDFDVTVNYRNPSNGDLADMTRILDQAAARNYDGVVTTIPDYDVVKAPIGRIIAKHIPVITFNSGTAQQSESLGALLHVGQPEYDAGKAAGERAKAAGVKRFLCVNNNVTNPVSFERCRGFGDAIGEDFKQATIDSGNDPTGVENRVFAALRKRPDTQAILTLGPTSAVPSLRAVQKLQLTGKIYFATFDVTPEVDKAIEDGTVAVAIDQQPYLQGYIPVAMLAIMKRDKTQDIERVRKTLLADANFQRRLRLYGLIPHFGVRNVDTGPSFVTRDNVALVKKYAGQYR
ncbi:MAG: sugar transporter substrate-binding protein [Caballeronia sp.]|jgi:simple sugar transport system substrate-binding protein|uniref:sugar ABC transporter substrate-binding protein n=1 Tax=Caballeronia sp. TaxID=1931223 RepID=UPI00260D9163|nr:sugar ABC transporter substrate-binding protein [Caballeronia sp.]MDB5830441.1 sugar transporter substrate-binding protein [Caballeronia sp.]